MVIQSDAAEHREGHSCALFMKKTLVTLPPAAPLHLKVTFVCRIDKSFFFLNDASAKLVGITSP